MFVDVGLGYSSHLIDLGTGMAATVDRPGVLDGGPDTWAGWSGHALAVAP
jgi:hypothetical protein